MKKLILIALAFVSLQAVAQEKQKKELKERKGAKMEMRQDMTAEDQATIATKKMTLALDLSEKQQAQVKELYLKQATVRKEKMQGREKMVKREDAKKPSKDDRLKMQNARLDEQIEMKKQMKSILNADQYVKWEKVQSKRMENSQGKQKMRIRTKN